MHNPLHTERGRRATLGCQSAESTPQICADPTKEGLPKAGKPEIDEQYAAYYGTFSPCASVSSKGKPM